MCLPNSLVFARWLSGVERSGREAVILKSVSLWGRQLYFPRMKNFDTHQVLMDHISFYIVFVGFDRSGLFMEEAVVLAVLFIRYDNHCFKVIALIERTNRPGK